MLTEVALIVPTSTADLIWVFFSFLTPLLISGLGVLLWYIGTRILGKMDIMNNELIALRIEGATTSTSLVDHIGNDGVHCKNGDCQGGFKAARI